MNPESRKPRILIGDGDKGVLDLLQVRFELSSFRTVLVRSGPELLENFKGTRPSAIVLDLALPVMDGFQILEALSLRSKEALPCPVLVTSSKLAPEDIKRALSFGARDCMTKPFSGGDVVERVRRILRSPARPALPVQEEAQDDRDVAYI